VSGQVCRLHKKGCTLSAPYRPASLQIWSDCGVGPQHQAPNLNIKTATCLWRGCAKLNMLIITNIAEIGS